MLINELIVMYKKEQKCLR